MSDTLFTNTSGYDLPGASYSRNSVMIQRNLQLAKKEQDAISLTPFIGKEGSGLPIIQKNELQNKPGDTIRIYMNAYLSNLGSFGSTAMEDAEEVFPFYYKDVFVNSWRNAIKDDGKMSNQRGLFNIHKVGIPMLGEWYGQRKDDGIFNTLYYGWPPHILGDAALMGYAGTITSLKPNKNWYCADSANNPITYSATDATYISAIQAAEQALTDTESDWFGAELLEGVAAKLATLNVPKVSYKGWSGHIGILHTNQVAQLRMNDKWFSANINAMPRDAKNNPIFSGKIANGAIGEWNGILLFKSNKVHNADRSTYTDLISSASGSATVEIDSSMANVRRALFLGRNAVALAVAQNSGIQMKDDFDYNFKKGEAVEGIWGAARQEYTSDDASADFVQQGSMVVSTYSPETTI